MLVFFLCQHKGMHLLQKVQPLGEEEREHCSSLTFCSIRRLCYKSNQVSKKLSVDIATKSQNPKRHKSILFVADKGLFVILFEHLLQKNRRTIVLLLPDPRILRTIVLYQIFRLWQVKLTPPCT